MELYWPSDLVPAASRFGIRDNAGHFSSPLTGFSRSVFRPGSLVSLALNFQNLNGQARAALQSFLPGLGGSHRTWAHDHSNRLRGSFPAGELLVNNTFANGTTGWTPNSATLSANDRVLRLKRTLNTPNPFATQSLTGLTQFMPYVARAHIGGASQLENNVGVSLNIGIGLSLFGLPGALRTVSDVANATTGTFYIDQGSSGAIAGGYYDCDFTSVARCGLVDNSPNAVLRSDELGDAAWNKTRTSIATNSLAGPNGTTTADSIIEDTSTNTHEIFPATAITRTSQAEDLCVYGYFKEGAGARDIQLRVGSDSSNYSSCIFDLGAGTAGSPSNVGTATNGRAFIVDTGGGWYFCSLINRVAASTSFYNAYLMVSAGAVSYTGNGSNLVYGWRLGCARSSVSLIPGQTVATAAASGTLQNLAGGLNTKGWPASTNGLLLPGDQVQIGSQLLFVIAAVNTDAAGRAILQLAPAFRAAPADNAPVIINQPMGKFRLESPDNSWSNAGMGFSDSEVVLVEAP